MAKALKSMDNAKAIDAGLAEIDAADTGFLHS
jgi:hypothetical protein